MSYAHLVELFDNGIRYKDIFDEYIDPNTYHYFLKMMNSRDQIIEKTRYWFYSKILDNVPTESRNLVHFITEELEKTRKVIAIVNDSVLAEYHICLVSAHLINLSYYKNKYADLTPIKYNYRLGKNTLDGVDEVKQRICDEKTWNR